MFETASPNTGSCLPPKAGTEMREDVGLVKIFAELLKLIFQKGNRDEIRFHLHTVQYLIHSCRSVYCVRTGQRLLYAYKLIQ